MIPLHLRPTNLPVSLPPFLHSVTNFVLNNSTYEGPQQFSWTMVLICTSFAVNYNSNYGGMEGHVLSFQNKKQAGETEVLFFNSLEGGGVSSTQALHQPYKGWVMPAVWLSISKDIQTLKTLFTAPQHNYIANISLVLPAPLFSLSSVAASCIVSHMTVT